ncbi:S1 family peptidase [Streptosporangium sp. DT93]|uniref:S1 family peptidase n=1 Tax=Streptosporangium sp. DT93 TaxID=3393428 RepID=UPI003CE92F07
MFRTRAAVMGWCLAITALAPVGASALATHPAQVTSAAPGDKALDRSVAAKPPVGMLVVLQRDLGLTEDQARSRLLNEVRLAPIAAQLRRRLGTRFAGSWLLEPTARTLVVATTSPADLTEITAQGARPLLVRRSLAELQAIKDRLAAGPLSSVSSVRYIDVRTNKVIVRSATPQAAAKIVRTTGLASDAVKVIASAEQPRSLPTTVRLLGPSADLTADLKIDLVGGQAYLTGAGTRCSIGFSVTHGDRKGFVSAGHCGTPNVTTVGFNRLPQGVVQASTFPGDDHSWVAVNDTWVPRPLVGNDSGGTIHVSGHRQAVEGASVCLSGSSSTGLNWRCGVITQRDADVTYPQGVVDHLIRTSTCGQAGDSGAAMLSVDQAQGVVSGGSGNCPDGGVTYVQPIGDTLTAYDLTLITDDTARMPSTGVCTGYPQTATGTLAGAQSVYRPVGSPYRTTVAGNHYGCLNGRPDGDFDLYLQKQTGSVWNTVAASDSPQSFEELGYWGLPGDYRYMVLSSSGTGSYTLGYTTP